jgi:hypothetical protein
MDAARTARRLGAEEALIVYRRDRAHMPAHGFEADEAMEEGVRIKWLTSIREIAGANLTVEIMELDARGRPQPTGQYETLQADALVLALGQETESGFLKALPGIEVAADGVVKVGPEMMTGHPGIFAGGDMVAGERTVTVSVGHGKLAARHIDAWLRGGTLSACLKARAGELLYAACAGVQRCRPCRAENIEHRERVSGFEEVPGGLERKGSSPRGAALPILRELFRMRCLLRGLVPRTLSSSWGWDAGIDMTTPSVRAVRFASSSARVTPSR